MNPIQIDTKTPRASSFLLANLLFFLAFFIFSSLLDPFDRQLSYLFLVGITLAYSLWNLTTGYLVLEQRNVYMLSVISMILGVSRFTYTLYLLLMPSIETLPVPFRAAIALLVYIRPYLTAIATLLTCKLFANKTTLKTALRIFISGAIISLAIIFIMVPYNFIFQLFPQALSSLLYIKANTITVFYLISLFYLWKKGDLIGKPIFISTAILFTLITISEVIIILTPYSSLGVFHYLAITFPLYFLYSTKVQYSILSVDTVSPTQQRLYKLNADLMNNFFTFKNTEVQNLRAEADAKEGLYKQLFDFAPDAFLICTNDTITYINQATLSLFNATDKNQILNANLWNFIHPDSISLVKSICRGMLETKADTMVDEIQIVALDSTIKDVRVSSTVFSFSGSSYIILSLYDLTNDKAHQLIQTQLEENVANEKFKVEFFANISHDLKTPVNVIYSATQLQDLCAADHDYDKVQMYNNVIKQNCLRLQKLLNDLLDMTKLDANRFKACPRLCNIVYIIENITQSVTSYVEQKNISIIFDTNVEEKLAQTDPDLIERILLNLISNAIKYGKGNGHIWVTLYDEGNHLVISIKDDGIGIPQSQVPLIFNRFHKVENHLDAPPGGNGIGLSLVKSMVDILGGNISCISKEGSGSEFIVILPMVSCKGEYHDLPLEDAIFLGGDNNLSIELSNT